MVEILEQQLPFLYALTLCVFANSLCGAVKHGKIKDFDWKELLKGTSKYLLMMVCIMCLVLAANIYEPLYIKFAQEIETIKVAIAIAAFAKVIIQIKEYFEITDEDIKAAQTTFNTDKVEELG